MRILFITWNYPPKVGGMESMLSNIVTQLRQYSNITVIGPYDSEHEQNDKITIRPQKRGLLAFMLTALFSGAKLLRRNKFDVIVTGSALTAPLSLLLGTLFHLPVVVYIHGLDLLYKNQIYQSIIHFTLPRCNLLFANSTNTAKIALNFGVDKQRIKVINPGIDFSEFKSLPEPDGIYEQFNFNERAVILSAGRLVPRKGIPEFIENVMPDLIKEYPHILFLIAGDNPVKSLAHKEDVKDRIIKIINKHNLNYNVKFLGFVSRSQLLKLYSLSNIFILPAIDTPSDIEGFGIVLIEAGAAGLPVVSTRLGGITDAVEDNHTGLLVNAGDWGQLRLALKRLLDDRNLQRIMGESARKRVEKSFDWPILGIHTLNLLKLLINKINII